MSIPSHSPSVANPITHAEYSVLSPKAQGYVSYMQGAWNRQVPEKCPYPAGSEERKNWERGQLDGVLEAQDCDD